MSDEIIFKKGHSIGSFCPQAVSQECGEFHTIEHGTYPVE